MTTIVPEMPGNRPSMLAASAESTEEMDVPAVVEAMPTVQPMASSQWDVATKRTVLVILLIVAIFTVWLSSPVITPLLLAGILSYLLNPIIDACERIHISRNVSTIVLFVLLAISLILLPILLVPVLVDQLTRLGQFNESVTAANFLGWVSERFNHFPDTIRFLGFTLPLSESIQQLETNFKQFIIVPTLAELLNYIQQLVGTATNVVSSTALIGISVVGGILQVFLTLIVVLFLSLYMTKDAPSIRRYVEGLFPTSYHSELVDVLRRIGRIWQSFFRGQLILCFTVSVFTSIALQLEGMPGALIFGIIAGILEVVPTLGPILSAIPAVIVALIQGSDVLAAHGINHFGFALIVLGTYFIIQQTESHILVPRIIGESVNLHPIVVICGAVVGFNVAGLLGTFLAAPVIASVRVIGTYVHAKLLDYPPFLDQPLPQKRPRRTFVYRRTVRGRS